MNSSSGIYALALALACHEAGLRCVVVGSTTIDETLRLQLGMLGVRLEQMPPSRSLRADQDRRVARVRELLDEHPDWHWMRQYHDAVHYRGYQDLARDLGLRLRREGWEAVELVAPVGSGASSGALALGLAASGVDVHLTGVQPFGSVTFGSQDTEDPDMLIAGIGSSVEFRNVRTCSTARSTGSAPRWPAREPCPSAGTTPSSRASARARRALWRARPCAARPRGRGLR